MSMTNEIHKTAYNTSKSWQEVCCMLQYFQNKIIYYCAHIGIFTDVLRSHGEIISCIVLQYPAHPLGITSINAENLQIQSLHCCLFKLVVLLFASEEISFILWKLEVQHRSIRCCVGSDYKQYCVLGSNSVLSGRNLLNRLISTYSMKQSPSWEANWFCS
jgi:hypothetical protein